MGKAPVLIKINSNKDRFLLLQSFPVCRGIFPRLEEMCDVHFKIPEYAEYRTAIGAALCYIRNREYKDIFCGKC